MLPNRANIIKQNKKIMKTKIAFLILMSYCILSKGQYRFQNTLKSVLNVEPNDVIQNTDSNYVFTGVLGTTGSGTAKLFVGECNKTGALNWLKTYSGPSDIRGVKIVETFAKDYVIVGWTNGFGAGADDIYVLKTNPNGDSLWTKTYGGTSYEYGLSIKELPDSSYIIVGQTTTYGAGSNDVLLIRINQIGNVLWTKTIGNTGQDYGNDVIHTSDNHLVVTGYTTVTSQLEDVYLIKLNLQGDTLWTKSYGTVETDIGYSLIETIDSSYLIVGYSGTYPDYDILLLKVDQNGNLINSLKYGSTNRDEGHSVILCKDSSFAITGYTKSFGSGNGDVCLLKIKSNLSIDWAYNYGGANLDMGNSVYQTFDNGFIITAYSSSFGAVGSDVYMIKTDKDGISGCNQTPIVCSFVNVPCIVGAGSFISSGLLVGGTNSNINPTTLNYNSLCVDSLAISIGELLDLEIGFTITPNPFTTNTTITFNEEQRNTSIKIKNLLGEEIKVINFTGKQLLIDKAEMKAGVYFVQTTNEQHHIYTEKIIIQ